MENDLYAVGLIPEPVKGKVFEYQNRISQKYALYEGGSPELHITLSKLNYNNLEQVENLIAKLKDSLESFSPPDVEIHGVSCFAPPFKSVNFHVETSPLLSGLSDLIKVVGKSVGMDTEEPFAARVYHISIGNPTFAKKQWTDEEYSEACNLLSKEDFHEGFRLNQIELWRPVKEEYLIQSFNLKQK